jgi:hypothetical protein
MEGSFNNRERRSYPRFFIDLPAEYRDMDDSCLRGAIVVNASEGGFLIESPRDLPVGTELSITVLYPKECELDNFKVTAKIVRKEPHWKGDWKGYQYGLELIQILEEDRRKLSVLLGSRFNLEQMLMNNEVSAGRRAEF